MPSTTEPFKDAQRAIWAAGDYAALSKLIHSAGRRVVAAAGVGPGTRVLDVACGTGNAARAAAQAGADVTGLDLTPELLKQGRQETEREGLEIEWVEGDAEDLPFDDDSFDCVVSTFGHMFAPRHRRAADEMTRVCRPGGTIATCTWTPEGSVGSVFAAGAAYAPPPPEYASPPILWGTEQHVRELFPNAREFRFDRDSATIEWESIDGFATFFLDRFGPMVTAREALGERFSELRDRIVAVWGEYNQADDGSLRLPQEYLLSVIRL